MDGDDVFHFSLTLKDLEMEEEKETETERHRDGGLKKDDGENRTRGNFGIETLSLTSLSFSFSLTAGWELKDID